MIYYLNNVPYYCYPEMPDILFPVYPVYQEYGLPEITSTSSDVNSLEEYVKNMENQVVKTSDENANVSCWPMRKR